MRNFFMVFFQLTCLSISLANAGNLDLYDLRIDHLTSPMGIEKDTISLSWKISSTINGTIQKSYQYEIFALQGKHTISVLKSKVINSDSQNNIYVDIRSLKENTKYSWRVICWTNNGMVTSSLSYFHIGIRSKADLEENWIWTGNDKIRTPYFQKKIRLKDNIKSAYLYISGQGYYNAFIDGRKIGNSILTPLPSQSQYRVYYDVYDVAGLLKDQSRLVVTLGEGQSASTSNDTLGRFSNKARSYPGLLTNPSLWAKLYVEYGDGETDIFSTDESWRWTLGPIKYNSFYGGENVDATIPSPVVEYDDCKWEKAVMRKLNVRLSRSIGYDIKLMDTILPVDSIVYGDSLLLYDLGQNIGGFWTFDVSGDKGTVVEVNGAETLNNSDFPKKLEYRDRLSDRYSHGLGGFYERDAKTKYILSGDGVEKYQPSFFYSGFRYIQVRVHGKINYLSVRGCTAYTGMSQQATFECSDSVLNRLHRNTIWSIKGIAQGAPMSNPNSEKYGWTGDAHLYTEPAMMLFDSQTFWEKWLNDIRDGQLAYSTGNVINTIPNYRRDVKTTSATWGAAYPLCVWYSYCFYNDQRLLHKHLSGLEKWCTHLDELAQEGLIKGVWGDHVPPGFLDGKMITRSHSTESSELVASVYYYVSHFLLSKIAGIIGEKGTAMIHAEKAKRIAVAINNKYLDKNIGFYRVSGTPDGFFSEQTVNAIPLQYGIVPDRYKEKVLDFLVSDIKKHGDHLTTGIMGTKALVDVLPANGYEELFWKIATQPDYPGWGFWVKKGATTHWQHWSGFPDHNHAMYGSVENYILSHVGGIRMASIANAPIADKKIVIEPKLTDQLDYVKCKVPTIYGNVSCSWNKAGGFIHFDLEIPVGLTARFIFTNKIDQTMKAGKYKFSYPIEETEMNRVFKTMPWTLLARDFGEKSKEGRIVQTKRMVAKKKVHTFPASYFRKEYHLADTLQIIQANWYVVGIGYHNCYLNGKKITNDLLSPSPTSYDKTVMYKKYDISDFMKKGSNLFSVSLANGFMGQNVAFVSSLAYGQPRMKSFLQLQLSDGGIFIIPLEGWKSSIGPVLFDNIYAGMTYDSRCADDWMCEEYDDSSWKSSYSLIDGTDSLLYRLDDIPAIKAIRTIKPVSVVEVDDKVIVDFGENISGVVRLKNNERSGKEIKIVYGEVFRNNKMHLLSTGIEATGVPQMDILITNGVPNYSWAPDFTYHGFRYVEISGLSSYSKDDFEAIVLHNDLPVRTDFKCSNSLMNHIYDVSCRTLSSNIHGIPEDCPHREKCAWLGDAHLVADFTMQRYSSMVFWRKYCYDIFYELSMSGESKPTMVIPGKRTCGEASFDWGIAMLIIPWKIYKEYGDITCLHSLYPSMKKYMATILKESNGDIIKSGLGDWCPPLWDRINNPDVMECTPEVSSSALFCHALQILEETSFLLCDVSYNRYVSELLDLYKKRFHDCFYDSDRQWYGSQTASVMALKYQIVPERLRRDVFEGLVSDIRRNTMHHNTGVFGSKYLYSILSENGYHAVADSLLLNPTFPSYAYTINEGMSTWPERQWRWNRDIDFSRSLNHIMHVGFTSYFTERLLGIRQDDNSINYRSLLFEPFSSDVVEWATGSLQLETGRLECSWTVDNESGSIILNIPKGYDVTLVLNDSKYSNMQMNNGAICRIQSKKEQSGINLTEGNYMIKLYR